MYCKKCGSKVSRDSNFCEKCGTKIEVEEMEELVDELLEDTMIDIEPSIKKVKEKIKLEKKSPKVIDIDLSDYKPDESDILVTKKSPLKILLITVLLIGLTAGIYLFISKDKEKKEKEADTNQNIINEYGKTIEDVASTYLNDHEIINDYDEIKDLVKYDKHKVDCTNTFINIDGTVYLSDCSIDGNKVEEVYGKKKNIITKDIDACRIDYNSNENQIEFYTDNKLVSVYECNNYKCGQYKTENFEYNSCLDSITVIEDGNYKYLYNYKAGQEVINKLDEIGAVKNNNKYVGFIVKDSETEKYGYITTRGIIKVEMKYDNLGLISDGILYDRGYNVKEDKLVAYKDNKYGVVKLTTGEPVMDFKYDYISLTPNNYYVIRDGKKYHLIDSKGNKVLKNEYDMIFAFDNLLVVNDNQSLKIIDYKENKKIDDEITTTIDYKEDGSGGIFGYNAYKEGNNIIIEVNSLGESGYITTKYQYNISKNTFSEIK